MRTFLYIGSFCPGGPAGYSVYSFEEESGSAELISDSLFPEISAGTAVFDEERRILYATDERPGNPAFLKGGGGRVFALRADPESGLLSRLDETLSYGARPSFAAIDPEKKYLLVTNFGASKHAGIPVTRVRKDQGGNWGVFVEYEDASTALIRLNPDGSFGVAADVLVHGQEGRPDPRIPHAHCVKRSPDGNLFAVCEMGTDSIYMLKIDRENGKILVQSGAPYRYHEGYGPRYCAFHPEIPFFFVNAEDVPAVTSFRYDADGNLEEICTVNVMPEGEEPVPELQSGFAMSHDGRFLYSAMRKYDLLNVFSVDQETGQLKNIQTFPLSGEHPKDCALSPGGRYLAVTCRRSGYAELLRVTEDGTVSSAGLRIPRKDAGCVFFLKG
ncbi:MAG: beta-propeller fold lactonase family protein [Stomatobaculum sp.]|nr:beta-propeller fold lactonase family protein [Stomatobaculum sp.]